MKNGARQQQYCVMRLTPFILPLATVMGIFWGAVSLPGQDQWGNLKGTIVVDGKLPPAGELLVDGDDRAYCLRKGESFTDQTLLVGDNGGLSEAFIMMYFARGDDRRPDVHPSYQEQKHASVVISNKHCRFEPHAVFLRTGQKLSLQNEDTIGHNCHIVGMQNEDNLNLGSGASVEIAFDKSERIPGIVKCDIHRWMEAIILIRDEPYAAITDTDGNFLIENIPAGDWTFQFWHKRAGYMTSLKRQGESESFLGRRGEVSVTIKPGETIDMGTLVISAKKLEKK